jgi:hypothetical protein
METTKWIQTIDSITNSIHTEFGDITVEQLNWKPNPDTWSIGQIIDHLIVINKTYFPIIKQLQDGTYTVPWTGRIGFMVRLSGAMILKSVQPNRKKKMKTFPVWEPATSTIPADIIQQFEKHQAILKNTINECSKLLDAGVVISSPANKMIVYKLETAFDIIVTHEQRHLEQARETLR